MNQQAMDTTINISNAFYNAKTHSDSTKNDAIFHLPSDVDFSVNYEPVGEKVASIVSDAKDSGAPHKSENGHKDMMTIGVNHFNPTNLHNYSKMPESDTLNCSDNNNNNNNNLQTTSDQEYGNRDDNNNPSNRVDDKKPDFHLRRPMNAFLIFCKRHRALVREKYPNLENRSITKILGDWWAFLPNDEKSPYKELAKNYKDVFFSKNPNFKWYKLPAPPLRTLSTRPTNDRSMVVSPTCLTGEDNAESIIKDRVPRNVKAPQQQTNSGIGQFKFASIDQMGGLTSLMTSSGSTKVNGTVVYDTKNDEKNDDRILETIKKRKNDNTEMTEDNESFYAAVKSHRACKGKRYQQFMTPSKKVSKQKITSNLFMATATQFPHNDYCKPQHDAVQKPRDDSLDELSNIATSVESEETEQRNVDAADFKLNEKILTLPSLDLDDYLNQKKAMKQKKKFIHKAKHRQHPTQIAPKDKAIPKPVVGSQKRKPKQTIRRTMDINQPEIVLKFQNY